MDTIAGFPHFPIEFSKDGTSNQLQRDAAIAGIPASVTDLYVASHGWNNDMAEARQLYDGLFGKLRDQLPGSPAATKQIAVIGVFWPSKKFAASDLIPNGNAQPVGHGVTGAEVQARLNELASLVEHPASKTAVAAASQEVATISAPASQTLYLNSLRDAIRHDVGEPEPKEDQEDASTRFFKDNAPDIFDRLKVPPGLLPRPPKQDGGGGLSIEPELHVPGTVGLGAAQGLPGLFRSFEQRALDLANFTTYYVMKKRAGSVGTHGVAPIVDEIALRYPTVRIHLVGHSFGGRLVTAVATSTQAPVGSLALLQAAYSHNGLGQNESITGFFRDVILKHKVVGPIIVTHSNKDRAVGLAYPIASRLANDNARALGDKGDPFGGMGANGAQLAQADESQKLTPGSITFAFARGKIFNLEANALISNHSDIVHDEIARAMLTAIST